MISIIHDEWRLYSLRRKIKKVHSDYEEDLKKAEKEDDRAKIDELLCVRDADCEEYKIDVERIKTRQLLEKAEKYCVKFPRYGDKEKWEMKYYPYIRILTEEAYIEIKKAIREEEREEEKLRWQKWSILISLLIGLGGIIVAIISLLLK